MAYPAIDGRYFRYGGEPKNYMAQWGGLSPPANARGSRELGEYQNPPGLVSTPWKRPTILGEGIQLGDLMPTLSTNEQRLAIAGAAVLGVVLWRKMKKRR